MSDFKEIKTQEEFDLAITQRIQRERDTISKQYSDYEELKNKVETLENEKLALSNQIEDYTSKHATSESLIAELNSKIQGYETNSVKMRIALEMGLPYQLASRLTGNDEESIRKDAESLFNLMGSSKETPIKSSEPVSINEKNEQYRRLIENLGGN